MIGEYSILEVGVFAALVVAALLLDLHAHKADKPISMRDAALWSVFWIALSLAFALYVGFAHGRDQGMLFLTGYFLEKSLSVDNLFVFIAVFASFSIRPEFQHRVLYFGIIGAVIMRLLFVVLGTSFIALFGKLALTIFGLFVLWTAWKMWQAGRQDDEEIEDYSNHWSVRLTRRIFPVSPQMRGHDFFVRRDGVWAVTPLFLCLVTIEIADVMFAFDSVPAIFAIFAGLREPLPLGTQTFLVYTSNIFAILGLRSLYFLLAAANRFLSRLEAAVIIILVFIGAKMLTGVLGTLHMPPEAGLIVVFGVLAGGVIASYLFPKKAKNAVDGGDSSGR
ncbi:MAG: TerC/Alx family metal homeostasis membrane protein [Desulfovibrio sp.]|jgi:tellurite resistance protein TerC|nr:TerC/Alx family metal homeostasis membrane protein [Desulfovibrio sp.]